MILTVEQAIERLQGMAHDQYISISVFSENDIVKIGKDYLEVSKDTITQNSFSSNNVWDILTQIDEKQLSVEKMDSIIESYIDNNLRTIDLDDY